jgi:beta-phosphoglucomutase
MSYVALLKPILIRIICYNSIMQKAIIFDLDGVVVDTERSVWHESSVKLLLRYNKKFDVTKVGHLLYGAKFEDATRSLYDFYKIEDSFENFLRNRRELVRKGFAENVTVMAGFYEFYKRIDGRKKAIATSMDNEFLTLTLNHLPLTDLFGQHIYTIAQSGGRGKPHPDIFLYAAKMIDQKPEDCVVIEDAPKGIEAAKSAGMRAIGLATSVSKEHLSKADYIVNSFSELTEDMLA